MTSLREKIAAFRARGGGWVAMQMVLLAVAFLIPLWFGQPAAGVSTGWKAAGWVLIAIGAVFFVLGAVALGRALTPFPQPLAEAELHTGGIYAWVRHPIYSGLLWVLVGWSLRSLSIAGLLFDVVLLVFFDRKAAREEQWLLAKYPDYAVYRRRVRKLIPWIY